MMGSYDDQATAAQGGSVLLVTPGLWVNEAAQLEGLAAAASAVRGVMFA